MSWPCCHLTWSWLSLERESDFVDVCSLLGEVGMEVTEGCEELGRKSCDDEAKY